MNGNEGFRGSGEGPSRRHVQTVGYASTGRHGKSVAIVCTLAFLFLAPFAHAQGGDPVRGEKLVNALGCMECHTINGVGGGEVKAPEWVDVFGKTEELEGGDTVVVDEAYLRESIQNPDIKVVKGYPAGKMPPKFKFLPEEDLAGMVAFIKSLSVVEAAEGVLAEGVPAGEDGTSEAAGAAGEATPPDAGGTHGSTNIVIGLFIGVAVCAFALGVCPSQSPHSSGTLRSRKPWRFPWPA